MTLRWTTALQNALSQFSILQHQLLQGHGKVLATTNYQMNLDGNTCITDDGLGDSHFYSRVFESWAPQPKIYNYSLRSGGAFERSHVRTRRLITHSSHIAVGSGMSFMFLFEQQQHFLNLRTNWSDVSGLKRTTFKIDKILRVKLITIVATT